MFIFHLNKNIKRINNLLLDRRFFVKKEVCFAVESIYSLF